MKFRQTGFTLLESMAAIVILTMGLLATYGWIDISVRSLVKVNEVTAQELIISEFLENLSITNLETTRQGRVMFKERTLEWKARPIETKSGVNNIGFVGLYDHTLYNIDITLKNSGRPVGHFSTRYVTTRRVREPRYEF